jgi:hypothetical protein
MAGPWARKYVLFKRSVVYAETLQAEYAWRNVCGHDMQYAINWYIC